MQLKKVPTVAILMTTYNGEKYLEEQLKSLVSQENVNINILVRDDGSNDSTIDILNKWQDEGKLTWYTGERLNVANGFFDLVEKSMDADYYAFSDQDDVWDKDKLYIGIKALKLGNNNVPQLYCSGSRLVDKNRKFISNHSLDKSRTQKARLFFPGVAGNTMIFNNVLKNMIKAYRPVNMKLHDTWIFKLCTSLGGQIIIDPNGHLDYRQHGDNVLGMDDTSLIKKINKFLYIIHESKSYIELMELYDVYGEKMTEEYKELFEVIKNCRKSYKNRMILLKNSEIDFNNWGFNLAFKLKILLNKL